MLLKYINFGDTFLCEGFLKVFCSADTGDEQVTNQQQQLHCQLPPLSVLHFKILCKGQVTGH